MKTPKIAKAMNHIDDEMIQASESHVKAKRPNNFLKITSFVAMFAIVLCASLLTVQMFSASATESTVALDVNPSIELELNKKDRVVEAIALNEDAEIVLDGLDLDKTNVDTAIYAIIGKMFEKGYLSAEKNSILVSVNSKNDEKLETLKENALLQVEKAFDAASATASEDIVPSIIIQDYVKKDKKEDSKISAAKETLIERVIEAGLADANGIAYTYEQLAEMNVHELKMLLDAKNIAIGSFDSKGEAAVNAFASKEEVIAFVLEEAGVTAEEISGLEVEIDYHKGGMIYSVEFVKDGVEYEYEVNAKKDNLFIIQMEFEQEKGEHKHEHPEGEVVFITSEEAQAKAFEHAEVEGVQAKVELDRKECVYKIEFKVDNCEYEYEIDAVTCEVVSFDIDMDIDLKQEEPDVQHHDFGKYHGKLQQTPQGGQQDSANGESAHGAPNGN